MEGWRSKKGKEEGRKKKAEKGRRKRNKKEGGSVAVWVLLGLVPAVVYWVHLVVVVYIEVVVKVEVVVVEVVTE